MVELLVLFLGQVGLDDGLTRGGQRLRYRQQDLETRPAKLAVGRGEATAQFFDDAARSGGSPFLARRKEVRDNARSSAAIALRRMFPFRHPNGRRPDNLAPAPRPTFRGDPWARRGVSASLEYPSRTPRAPPVLAREAAKG